MNITTADWTTWVAEQLDDIRAAGRWRATRPFDAAGPAGNLEGRPVVSFASNDYLGLSTHPSVVAAAHEALDRWGAGSTASRLIVGTRPCHEDLEEQIANWKGCERAVIFTTGFATNLGVLSVLGGPDVTIFSDELNHASIIDGCRSSRSTVCVYRHGDVEQLGSMLDAVSGRRIVATDSVFSMDGDVAPIEQLADLCVRHGAMLVVDEAHAVLGPVVPHDVDGLDVVRVGTLSKTLGSMGGWVAGNAPLLDLIINRSRPYIFTTAASPADVAAAHATLQILRSDEGAMLVRQLRRSIDRLVPDHPSPIIPIVLGDEQRALQASAALLEQGIFVPAIRPPTVPPGTSRLRVAVSAAHTDEMVTDLERQLALLGLR